LSGENYRGEGLEDNCRESEQDNEEAGAYEKEKELRQTKVDEHWNTFYPLNAVEY
jgi:hypothetical protein